MITRYIASAVGALSFVLLGFTLLLGPSFWGPFLAIPIALAAFSVVGALIAVRLPRNPVGWLLSVAGLLFQLTLAADGYAWLAIGAGRGWPGGGIAAVLATTTFQPALGAVVLMLLYFPDGRGLGGRWRWVERLFIAIVVVGGVTLLFADQPIVVHGPISEPGSERTLSNPLAPAGVVGELVTGLSQLLGPGGAPLILFGPLSLFLRYRRAPVAVREQFKWLISAGALSLGMVVASNLVTGDLGNVFWVGSVMSLGLVPVAIAVAIFRYRLYDIDVIIRRTLIYAGVSAVLVAAYVAAVAVLESLLAPFTGGSGIAVAASTLAVVALFQPVRGRIGRAVDRRFYRARYDADRTLDAFGARLRDDVDLAALERDLMALVDETLRPAHASLWLRSGTGPRG
jgi:hypothetical protein